MICKRHHLFECYYLMSVDDISIQKFKKKKKKNAKRELYYSVFQYIIKEYYPEMYTTTTRVYYFLSAYPI